MSRLRGPRIRRLAERPRPREATAAVRAAVRPPLKAPPSTTRPILGTVAFLLVAFAGCRSDGPASGGARRILSLAPSATEILFAIGAGSQVVGVDAYSDFPPEARSLPRLGGLLDPDLESMLRLRPDLAVLLPSQAEAASALEAAGVATLTIPHETLGDVDSAIRLIGRRTGHAAAAVGLADSLRGALRERERAEGEAGEKRRVLFVVAREEEQLASLTAAGPGTYIDELIRLAGGVNALEAAPVRYPQISAETVLRLGPDVLVEWAPPPPGSSARDMAAADRRRAREWLGLLGDPAGAEPAVRVVHDDLWLRPGPRVGQALDALTRVLAER